MDGPVFTHVLAALVLVSRLGDIVSTRLVTPRLTLEANAIARRLGWPFIWLSLLLALVPYFHLGFGVMILAGDLLVTASNVSRMWLARALGEAEYIAIFHRAARASRRQLAIACAWGSATAIQLFAFVLAWLGGIDTWTVWVALGVSAYGLAIGIHGTSFILRVHRDAGVPATSHQQPT